MTPALAKRRDELADAEQVNVEMTRYQMQRDYTCRSAFFRGFDACAKIYEEEYPTFIKLDPATEELLHTKASNEVIRSLMKDNGILCHENYLLRRKAHELEDRLAALESSRVEGEGGA